MKNQLKITFLVFITLTLSVFQSSAQTSETVVGWDGASFSYQSTDNATYWHFPYANTGVAYLGNNGASTMRTFGGVSNSTASAGYADMNQMIFNVNPGTGWASGSGSKGWVFSFNTTKYGTLKFSGKMAGSTSLSSFRGPRDFKLQYSLDNTSWTDVSGGAIAAGSAGGSTYTLASLSNITLPAACENKAAVYLRMIMTSNASPDGATATTSGQSMIDDFMVTGISVPEAPTNITLSNSGVLVSLGGATSVGLTIGALSSTDFNLGNTFTYTLVSGTGSTNNSSFSISGGNLQTAAALPAGSYNVRIRSTDNGSLYFEKEFTITVTEPDAILSGTRKRVSSMGTDGNTSFNANAPANIAYNSTNDEYFTVWQGDDNTSPLVDNELEIFGQRITASTGANVGSRIRISFMGTNGLTTFKGVNPSVAYNSTDNEYLVVWQGDHNSGTLVTTEDEIWGQRINASTGALIGSMFRISTMSTDGVNTYDAQTPDVVWNSTDNRYLVVWRADDNTNSSIDNEYEIYAQLVTNTGTLSGSRLQVSSMGGSNGNITFGANTPSVSWSLTNNKYFIVWSGDDNTNSLIDNENEIFGQAISNTNTLSGSRIQISAMGGSNGSATYNATIPDIAWNSANNQYLVVWRADDNTGSLIDNEYEIYGQLLTGAGATTGSRIRISDMGDDGNTAFSASNPKVIYHTLLNEYWVTWHGDDNIVCVDNENEIFGQRLTNTGTETGNNDFRISYMGTNGLTTLAANQPALAYNSSNPKAFVVWRGDDDTSPLVDNEYEIFGQTILIIPTILSTGSLSALTTTYGTVSSASSFTISGSNMVSGITVTPPSGFEVSLTSGSGYSTSVLAGSAGTINSTSIYVRLAASTRPAFYNGNIVLSSTGATNLNVATVSSTVNTKTLTVSGLSINNKVYDGNTSAIVVGTPSLVGIVGSDNVALSGTITANFTSSTVGTNIPVVTSGCTLTNADAIYYIVSEPTGLRANITNAPLPITLLGLSGERLTQMSGKKDIDVELKWSTASEVNNKGFEVQISEDNKAFKSMKTLLGNGNSSTIINYQTVIKNPKNGYYRLKQMDFDGNFSYSPIVFVEGIEDLLKIFPNPNNGHFRVDLDKNTEGVSTRLLNAQGMEVWKDVLTQSVDIDLNIPTGMYFLHILMNGKLRIEKILIL